MTASEIKKRFAEHFLSEYVIANELRNKVKRGEVEAYRCNLSYCIPIEEIIKLKKAGR